MQNLKIKVIETYKNTSKKDIDNSLKWAEKVIKKQPPIYDSYLLEIEDLTNDYIYIKLYGSNDYVAGEGIDDKYLRFIKQ